jgi:DNA-binding CsgD family transcriptional regulator
MSRQLHRGPPGGAPAAPAGSATTAGSSATTAHDARLPGLAGSLCSATNTAELTHRFESVPTADGLAPATGAAGAEASPARQGPGTSPDPRALLTPRERQIAELVVTGLTDRAIAAQLWLSHHTVSQHVKRVYRKLGVSSRVELTRLLVGHVRLS